MRGVINDGPVLKQTHKRKEQSIEALKHFIMGIAEFRIVGLPRRIDTDELENHIENELRGATVQESQYFLSRNKRTIAILCVETDLSIHAGAKLLRRSKFEGTVLHVELPKSDSADGDGHSAPGKSKKNQASREWQVAKSVAVSFYEYIQEDANRLERASDREELGVVFREFCESINVDTNSNLHRMESLVLIMLRQKKLIKTRRYGDKVIVSFAQGEPGDFASEISAKDRVLGTLKEQEENKNGVEVSEAMGLLDIVPIKGSTTFYFKITSQDPSVTLNEVTVGGPQRRAFAVEKSAWPTAREKIQVVFTSSGIGLYRASIRMSFTKESISFVIVRHLRVRSGDEAMDKILKPSAPYQKRKKRFQKPAVDVIPPPRMNDGKPSTNPFAKLPHHKIPSEVQQLLLNNELEWELEKPNVDVNLYAKFWKNLLWATEYQAYEDIKAYDMESAKLKREGRFMVLHVSGLAENRPSVLRGDLVNVSWKGFLFKGLVHQTRLLDVLMELDGSFHRKFDESLDTVDVRFTFSRTTLRTSHEACSKAASMMGKVMLTPNSEHDVASFERIMPRSLQWANRNLNDEQRAAVFNILKGKGRPRPFILFGPPGTGKTTTVVETVYQLNRQSEYLNILLVAPSNDAADILVEKLSTLFPPSEMRRVIAYSRTIDQVSPTIRPYVTEGLSDVEMCTEIMSYRIIVSTVNLAARFAYYGIPRGHFGALVVDEAGHTTEPELIGIAASLMDFKRQDSKVGQLVLAGDPKQLGPIITSDLCQKFGMSMSYMERLTGTDVYSRGDDGQYPADLLVKLVRTYRSHPAILKLPNEMFYDNELLACGDVFSTHSLVKWEHLPQQGFPIVFHAVNGENLREGTSPSWFNREEAQEVVNYVDLLVNQSRPAINPQDIGIITPYARQAQKIRQLLKHLNFDEIKVGSVETFQGQERRVIIISTVRAESELLSVDRKYNLGFVSNEKRFNVAVTRAKSLLIVVGSPSVLATDEKTWRPFLRYCKDNHAWAGQPWEEEEYVNSSLDVADSNDSWLIVDDGGVSQSVLQEGLGYINREE